MSQYVDWTATPVSTWIYGNVWECEWKWCVGKVVVLYLSIISLVHTQKCYSLWTANTILFQPLPNLSRNHRLCCTSNKSIHAQDRASIGQIRFWSAYDRKPTPKSTDPWTFPFFLSSCSCSSSLFFVCFCGNIAYFHQEPTLVISSSTFSPYPMTCLLLLCFCLFCFCGNMATLL